MKTFGRIVAATALLLAATLPARAAADEDLYDKGRSAVFEERWQEARQVFEDLTRRFPASAYADDAQYWLGMALYESGDPEKAYGVLKSLNASFPDSPWSDDARVLMIRCAESALMRRDAHTPGDGAAAGRRGDRDPTEYEAFIEKSTHDASSKVQLLAIDTMLLTNPGRAPELLPRLAAGRTPPEAAGLLLDRFFGGDKVKVTLENPALGLRDGNVAIMIRQDDRVTYLSLTEATDLIRSPAARPAGARFDPAIVDDVREKLRQAQRNLVREGDPGTVQTLPGLGGRSMSAIIRVVDGEVHYYRNGDETVRILVLKRQAGFNDENIRIFVEGRGGLHEMRLEEARSLNPETAAARADGVSEATLRYLKAALAIIEIDLARSAGAGTK